MNDAWTEPERLLRDWLRRARHSQHSHHEAGKFCRRMNYWLGAPAVVLTAIVGTAVFASIEKQVISTGWKLALGSLSGIAAIMMAMQTFFGFAEKTEIHKKLGAQYGNIRRDIEQILALPFDLRPDPKTALDSIRAELDKVGGEGPVVSEWLWNRTMRALERKDAKK
jgi:hypothetical protein